MQLDGADTGLIPLPSAGTPSRTIIAVNILWFSSLILSLFTALFGIFAKQWLHVYSKWSEGAKNRDTLVLRDFYQEGFHYWGVADIIGALPVLLQIALLLFTVGLVAYLWTMNSVVAGTLTSLVTIMVALVIVTIVLPLGYPKCPYKSPVGLFFLKSSFLGNRRNFFTLGQPNRAEDGAVYPSISSWKDRDFDIATHAVKNAPVLDSVITEACQVLDIHPHYNLEHQLEGDSLEGSVVEKKINGLPDGTAHLLTCLISASPTKFTEIYRGGRALLPLRLLVFTAQLARPHRSDTITSAIVELCSRVEAWKASNGELLSMVAEHLEALLTAKKPC